MLIKAATTNLRSPVMRSMRRLVTTRRQHHSRKWKLLFLRPSITTTIITTITSLTTITIGHITRFITGIRLLTDLWCTSQRQLLYLQIWAIVATMKQTIMIAKWLKKTWASSKMNPGPSSDVPSLNSSKRA